VRPEIDTRARLVIIGLVVVALFGGLLTRLWFLQVAGGENLAVAAQSNGDKVVQIPPLRGRIVDAQGRVLAETVPVTTLVVDRQHLDDDARARLVPALARVLGVTPEEVATRIDDKDAQPFEPAVVADRVGDDVSQYVWEHRDEFPATRVAYTYLRVYPQGEYAAHVVGYTGQIDAQEYATRRNKGYAAEDTIGKTGVEQTFESTLRGKPELKQVRVDNRGVKVDETVLRRARPGNDIQLSIDIDAQVAAAQSLQQGMEGARQLIDPDHGGFYDATGGAVVVLDARSGEVRALVSAPSFDPNALVMGGAPPEYFDPNGELPLIDRALNGYAPGSTFKLFTSIATLKYGIRTADETYNDEGCFVFGNDQELCNARKEAYGYVDLPRALTVSSDTYFYNAGNEFWNVYRDEGQDSTPIHARGNGLQETARAFGFGAPTGIALSGDQSGRIPDLAFRAAFNEDSEDPTDRTWRRGDSANLAVGQGDVLVTPLQLANGYAAFANGGTLLTPKLVTAIRASAAGLPPGVLGKMVGEARVAPPRPTGLTPELREPVLAGIEGVVADPEGTAYYSFNTYEGVQVAGKTGTAQAGKDKQDTSWFAAITNPENDPAQPQYVVVAMVEQGGFGADIAAPIVRRVVDFLSGNPDPPPVHYAPAPVKKND
jgi:penicillin-binding protein 2